MRNIRRIGIFGGTFNPIHMGHLVLAEQARQRLRLERVIFVPSNLPPHKRTRALATAQQRWQMVKLATDDNPCFSVSDIELLRGGRSYSIQTVRQFQRRLQNVKIFFIVGSDSLKEFASWKDFSNLTGLCQFIIGLRPGYPIAKLPKKMRSIPINALDISSSNLRKRIKSKQSIRYLVPEKVRTYILRKGLYR